MQNRDTVQSRIRECCQAIVGYKRLLSLAFAVFSLLFITAASSHGQENEGKDEKRSAKQVLDIPYAFYNENFGFAAGYVYSVFGYPQRQSTILATAMAGTTGSGMAFLMGQDIRLPFSERLFLDPIVSVGYFKEAEAYISGNPDFPDQRAGSNESDEDNFIEGDGWDTFFRLRFKYLLPLGHGKDRILKSYDIEDGLLKPGSTGVESWNPMVSGRTFFEVMPFYRNQQIDGEFIDEDQKTNGVEVSLFWDNRDFALSPSKGNSLALNLSRDFGWFDSSNSWTNVQGEFDLYFPLDLSDAFRQEVLAFATWTSYSPSWEVQADGTVENRPPAYTGSTLGGLWRMRGYPSQRFSDKAAVYYAAELRLIPRWNPFDQWPWIQKHLGIEWIQFAPFLEVGRVAPHWELGELHSDMKWNAGIGVRLFAQGIVVRVDSAFSEEGFGIQMMINQPFQF